MYTARYRPLLCGPGKGPHIAARPRAHTPQPGSQTPHLPPYCYERFKASRCAQPRWPRPWRDWAETSGGCKPAATCVRGVAHPNPLVHIRAEVCATPCGRSRHEAGLRPCGHTCMCVTCSEHLSRHKRRHSSARYAGTTSMSVTRYLVFCSITYVACHRVYPCNWQERRPWPWCDSATVQVPCINGAGI